ncbi:MAG: hypothetical protein WAM17_01780 [Rhodoplanes sp.]
MSDFDRDIAGVRYSRVSRSETAVIDAGLRAYMLRIYNYLMLGLAITGIAALGIYMLSVTGDAASAAHVLRGGTESCAHCRGHVSHADRLRRLCEPAEMGDHARPARAGVRT